MKLSEFISDLQRLQVMHSADLEVVLGSTDHSYRRVCGPCVVDADDEEGQLVESYSPAAWTRPVVLIT